MRGRSVTLGAKLMTSFLLVDLVLVAVGGFALVTQAALHDRIAAVASRDIVPLSHLRQAQNNNHSVTITGFAAMTAADPATRKMLTDLIPDTQKAADDAFVQLQRTTPAEMRAQTDDLIVTYRAMAAADEKYRANTRAANAPELAKKASDLYQLTEQKFDALAERFVADSRQQEAATNAVYTRSVRITAALLVLGVAAGLVLATLLTRSLRRRTRTIVEGMQRVAHGDLTASVTVSGSDEIAEMAEALNATVVSIRAAVAEVNGSATALADSASGLGEATDRTATAVHRAGDAVAEVATNAETVTRTVDGVASGTVELAASIRDISDNAQQAAKVAGNAVGVVEATNATISKLGNSSQEIGNVIQVIQNIAAQTSLLALNATIEAARAGEAGRGFAVVAGEVKDLARETAEATDSVITQVQAIQADTEGAIRAIVEIGEIIQQINGFQSTIAAAVEEQSVTTDSISASIADALQVTREIAANIGQVTDAAQGGAAAVGSTRELAGSVAEMGQQLRRVVANFRL